MLEGAALWWLVFVTTAAAGLVLATGHLGRRRKLAPNPFMGLRTRFTRSDDEVWYEVHYRAAPWALASGVAMLGAPAAAVLGPSAAVQAAGILAATLLSVTLLSAGSAIASRQVRARAR
ncbi:SdpI family protein [Nocardiopsis sp. NPDC006139]|uniref:SdpI family protein n=1 Tax=Nocardiopsis TaxID=2013 RepID=UPI0033A8367A